MPRNTDERSRSPLLAGLVASVLLHLLLFLLYPSMREDLRSGLAVSAPSPAAAPSSATRVVRLAPVEEVADTEPAEPLERIQPELPDVEALTAALEDPTANALELLPPTAAERLRTRYVVPELWAPLSPEALALPELAREHLVLNARITEWYDSLAVAASEATLADWTYTDSEGKRWGAADGMIYLGDFAIPIPFGFGVSNARREEVAALMWQWDELIRQGVRMELIESWEERQEAIRRRRDGEREARADTGGVGA